MPSAWFEPAIPAIMGPQNYPLDRMATGIGEDWYILGLFNDACDY
jgi:hypothetical protein